MAKSQPQLVMQSPPPSETDEVIEQLETMDDEYLPEKGTSKTSKKKPARRSGAGSNPRKHVRGKQGGLKGLMTMPIDIFTEIASYLSPGDLIALSWSSKSFRDMLLQRSALHLWRRAEKSVPDLPPCPIEMSEPQYAVLVFAKICTLCGIAVRAKVDPFLHVRLCPSCRATHLKEVSPWLRPSVVSIDLVQHSECIGIKLKSARHPRGAHPIFSLSQSVDEVLDKLKLLKTTGDKLELATWLEVRREMITKRREHAERLHSYLESVDTSHEQDMKDIREQRRTTIIERLTELGWTDRDIPGWFSPYHGEWWALVEVSKPLTDRVWNNTLPKLIVLLENNRARLDEIDEKRRRDQRRACIDKFLRGLNETDHALQPVVDIFKTELAHFNSGLDKYGTRLRFYDYELRDLFPNTEFALTWDCLNGLEDQETTLEDLEAELVARKGQIEQMISDWREDIDEKLAAKLGNGIEKNGEDVTAIIKGSTDVTAALSAHQRLLLRADTVFKLNRPVRRNGSTLGGSTSLKNLPHYYPKLVTRQHDRFTNFTFKPCVTSNVDLSGYERNTEAEKIIKLLLNELGVPNATRIELQAMGTSFLCGKCIDRVPKTWDQLVEHYIEALDTSKPQENNENASLIHYPIPYQNVHDLDSTDSSNPRLWLLTKEKVLAMKTVALDSKPDLSCLLCTAIGRTSRPLELKDMRMHLRDAHGVGTPLDKLHYDRLDDGTLGQYWYGIWNAFQAANALGSESPSL